MLVVAAAQALAPAVRHRTAPAIRHRSRPLMMANSDFGTFGQFGRVDLFDEPPTVGGVVVTAPATLFPKQLEQPAELAKKATITPFPDWASIVFAPSETGDLIAAVFVGTALLLGPDFLLAPAGIVSDDGIRPGFALERVVGELIDGDAQWLRDRRERLAADAPLKVRLPIWLLFVAAGLLVERLRLMARLLAPNSAPSGLLLPHVSQVEACLRRSSSSTVCCRVGASTAVCTLDASGLTRVGDAPSCGRELQLSAFSFHYYLAVFLSFGLRCSPLSKNIHQTTVKGMFQNVGQISVCR